MKITEITPLLLEGMVLVRVKTEGGIVGYGECSPMSQRVIGAHLRNDLIPRVIGQDLFDIEAIVSTLFTKNYKMAGQTLAAAISGLEIALWDAMGKVVKLPVYKLLGGAYRRKIPVYGSSMRRDTSPTEEADRLAVLVEKFGFGGVKLKVGGRMSFDADASPGRSLAVVAAVRKRLGDEIEICVDANSSYSVSRAIELGRRLEEFHIFHFEEPCPYSDLEASAQIAAALDVPIAGGEQEWELLRFREMLTRKAFDILQPDVAKAGGFLVCKKIAALAEAFGAVVTPHQTRPLAMIANLHFSASTPCCRYRQEANIEPKKPLIEKLIRNPVPVVDGCMTVPEGPGLGVELDEAVLGKAEVM